MKRLIILLFSLLQFIGNNSYASFNDTIKDTLQKQDINVTVFVTNDGEIIVDAAVIIKFDSNRKNQ